VTTPTLSISAADIATLKKGGSVPIQGPAAVVVKPPPPSTWFDGTLQIVGGRWCNGAGVPGTLVGANVVGASNSYAQGSYPTPWMWGNGGWNKFNTQAYGGPPDPVLLKTLFGLNFLRVPVCLAPFAGISTAVLINDASNPANFTEVDLDPDGNYVANVMAFLDLLTANEIYWSLDFHDQEPDIVINGTKYHVSPDRDVGQFYNNDNSLAAVTAAGKLLVNRRGGIIEPFNEPVLDNSTGTTLLWERWRDGANFSKFLVNAGDVTYNWSGPGMQAVVTAFRATTAQNPILCNGLQWAGTLTKTWDGSSGFIQYAPNDPLKQIAWGLHYYPGDTISQPDMAAAIAAGYPGLIGECSDVCANGSTATPFLAQLLAAVDALNAASPGSIGISPWCMYPQVPADGVTGDYQMIKYTSPTTIVPTDGFGKNYAAWGLAKKGA
jgi:Cellulase (glycosyl hydrolase family 5)